MFSNKASSEKSLIHSKFILTNVTALKFVEHLLFAGVAGNLLLYVASDGDYCKYKKFYQIHIFSGQNIHGIVPGRKIIVFGNKCVAVLDGASEQSSDLRMNVVSSWTIKDWIWDAIWLGDDEIAILTAHNVLLRYKWSNCELISETRCEDLSILYSGKIINSKWEDLVILSGTVYQEIVIWSVGDSKDVCSRHVLHRLKGHKGVIFSICYDSDSEQIGSTSDDRTVRVWSVSFPEGMTAVDRWSQAQITLKYTVFGHTARVWRSHFIPEGRLISIGEDGQICLWTEDGQLAGRWRGTSPLWCLDYREGLLATGAADGSITIWPISTMPPPTSLDLPRDGSRTKYVCFSSYGELVLLTESGQLIQQSGGGVPTWEDPRFSSYALLSLSPARDLLALASINGVLVIHSVKRSGLTKLVDQDILQCRIYALNWLNNNVLIVCGEEGVLTLWQINQSANDLEKKGDFVLPPCKERWITSAAMAGIHLVCGDRQGSVHLYCNNTNQKEPLDSLYKLHGSRGVSDIKFIDDLFYTSGRDGTFRKLIISDNNLQVLSTYNLSMDWAEAIVETEIFGTVIFGFHDVNFIMWSLKKRQPLIELKSGGGHRSWDCLITSRYIHIVFVKEKKIISILYPLKTIIQRNVCVGHHKKSINSACLVSQVEGQSFLVTGGEDTRVATSLWEDTKLSLHNTMDGHLSNVRAVCCVGNIVISAGGRAQLIVWSFSTSRGEGTLKLLKSHMIREEKRERRPWREAEPLVDPEMRYMGLDAILNSDKSVTIAAACSDGLLRLLEYNEATNSLTTTDSLKSDQQNCLLTVCLLRTEEGLMCLTTATDGLLTVWNLSASLDTSPVSHRLHSLGINCCSFHQAGGGRMVVATGGDDSRLCLSLIALRGKLEFTVTEHVHTAQITGVRLTADFVISVGLDQVLSILTWCLDGASIKTLPVVKFATSIPDAHGLLLRPTDQ